MLETILLTALDLDYQGQGICKHNNQVIFVKGLLKGETGLVTIKETKKKFAIGKLVSLKNASKDRVHLTQSESLYYAPLSHLNPTSQLEWQSKITQETIHKIANLQPKVEPILTDHKVFNYRNKVTFHVGVIENRIALGIYKPLTNQLKEIEDMTLACPTILKVYHHLKDLFLKLPLKDLSLKHIVIRAHEQKAMIVFVTDQLEWKDKMLFLNHLNLECIVSVYQNVSPLDYENLGKNSIKLKGEDALEAHIGNLKFEVGPTAFMQVNSPVALLMYQKVSLLIRGNVVIDAFAGMATIGQYIAKTHDKVISIESNPDAIASAKKALIENDIHNVELVLGDVTECIESYIGEADCIVFDPPRSGMDDKVRALLTLKPVKEIIYVSCDLKTLSRDINTLKDTYKITNVIPVKMFYNTIECETIVRLEKCEN